MFTRLSIAATLLLAYGATANGQQMPMAPQAILPGNDHTAGAQHAYAPTEFQAEVVTPATGGCATCNQHSRCGHPGCAHCGGHGWFGYSNYLWGYQKHPAMHDFFHSPCNMPQHWAYFPALHGNYYFRPYSAIDIPAQQQMVTRWGGNPRHPYESDLFNKARMEVTEARAKGEGIDAPLPLGEPIDPPKPMDPASPAIPPQPLDPPDPPETDIPN